ncbi:hypothetical protein APY04_3328 [Hyphomicrobium sulfonivorans]|uniref:Uncharacterized protein n=1 Tax=Hyphomicrobium sulfonivorans TaxID=121290 RepID=A0A109B8U3_HYPSL|nr:hypothetical protein [Hyphomicrobium sulfonivorans]KWT64316.1 hypothetical protein APY04_3328 [Hyphomicrobium sulfonivorans]
MMDNRKFLIFGFVACILAALAYVFVFADLPFATGPDSKAAIEAEEAMEAQTDAPAPVPAEAPAAQPDAAQ